MNFLQPFLVKVIIDDLNYRQNLAGVMLRQDRIETLLFLSKMAGADLNLVLADLA